MICSTGILPGNPRVSFFHLENVESKGEGIVERGSRADISAAFELHKRLSRKSRKRGESSNWPPFSTTVKRTPFYIQLSFQYPCGFLQDDPESRGNRASGQRCSRKEMVRGSFTIPLASIRCLLNKKKKLELIRIPEKDTRCRVAKGRRIDEGMPRHNHSVHRLMKKEVSEE